MNKPTLEELEKEFDNLNIPMNKPRFYNHENFKKIEEENPFFFNNYALFVSQNCYSEEYLKNSKRKVESIINKTYELLKENNSSRNCIDVSMFLMNVFDEEEIWNYGTIGSLTIEFDSYSKNPYYFEHYNTKQAPFGHSWLIVPPFKVVDTTINLQVYDKEDYDIIPKIVLAKKTDRFNLKIDYIADENIINELKYRGIKKRDMFRYVDGGFNDFNSWFKQYNVKFDQGNLKYVPSINMDAKSWNESSQLGIKQLSNKEVYEQIIKPEIDNLSN